MCMVTVTVVTYTERVELEVQLLLSGNLFLIGVKFNQ